MLFKELSVIEVGNVILGTTLFVITCYSIWLLFLVVIINRKIEILYREMEKEIGAERGTGRGIPEEIIELKVKSITDRYNKMIAPLVREKGYIFDIIPFLSKK